MLLLCLGVVVVFLANKRSTSGAPQKRFCAKIFAGKTKKTHRWAEFLEKCNVAAAAAW